MFLLNLNMNGLGLILCIAQNQFKINPSSREKGDVISSKKNFKTMHIRKNILFKFTTTTKNNTTVPVSDLVEFIAVYVQFMILL